MMKFVQLTEAKKEVAFYFITEPLESPAPFPYFPLADPDEYKSMAVDEERPFSTTTTIKRTA